MTLLLHRSRSGLRTWGHSPVHPSYIQKVIGSSMNANKMPFVLGNTKRVMLPFPHMLHFSSLLCPDYIDGHITGLIPFFICIIIEICMNISIILFLYCPPLICNRPNHDHYLLTDRKRHEQYSNWKWDRYVPNITDRRASLFMNIFCSILRPSRLCLWRL